MNLRLVRGAPLVVLSVLPVGCYAAGPMPWQATHAALAAPIAPRAGCTLWRGFISGNDRDVSADFELCPQEPEAARVIGRVQLRSDASGHSIRRVEGGYDAAGVLRLRDVGFDVSEPEFPWTFCRIDLYELRAASDAHLVGRYDSKACSDHARVDVVRVR